MARLRQACRSWRRSSLFQRDYSCNSREVHDRNEYPVLLPYLNGNFALSFHVNYLTWISAKIKPPVIASPRSSSESTSLLHPTRDYDVIKVLT